jgi:hypothetical protein
MGAWGTDIFQDDSSCDCLYEAMETNAKTFIAKAISYGENYLDYDECQEIIVSGVIIDSIINNKKYTTPIDTFGEWLSKQDKNTLLSLREKVISKLKRVISENSEIHDLWLENEDAYPIWKSNITAIIESLSK